MKGTMRLLKYWLKEQKYEMFVDFETFNDICMNMTIPKQQRFNMIYMIGVGIKDCYNNWFYKSFIKFLIKIF